MAVIARHCEQTRSDADQRAAITVWKALVVALATIIACMGIANGESLTKAGAPDAELTIREVIPTPFRCSRTSEPLFFCRHENPPGHSVILDLLSNLDGASASLTYNYDDLRRRTLLDTMRHFFLTLGIPAEAYDACISRAEWQRESILVPNYRVLCHRVELGDRVTYEIFAMIANDSPTVAYAEENLQ